MNDDQQSIKLNSRSGGSATVGDREPARHPATCQCPACRPTVSYQQLRLMMQDPAN